MKKLKLLLLPICTFAFSLYNVSANEMTNDSIFKSQDFLTAFGNYMNATSFISKISEKPWLEFYHEERFKPEDREKLDSIANDAKRLVQENLAFNKKIDEMILKIKTRAIEVPAEFGREITHKHKRGSNNGYRVAVQESSELDLGNMIEYMNAFEQRIQEFKVKYASAIDYILQQSSWDELNKKSSSREL